MTPEEWRFAQQMIMAECPTIFRKGERTPGHRNDGNFYFAVGSGWHEPIRICAMELERIAKAMGDPEDPEADTRPRVAQIKEKFGGLRFYVYGEHSEEVDQAIANAEAACSVTCETCGAPGLIRNLRWRKTLCKEHFAEREAREASAD
jgi:hypothetical protein